MVEAPLAEQPSPVSPPPPQGAAAPAQTPIEVSWRAPLALALEAKREKKRARLERIVALAAKKRAVTNNDVEMLLKVSDATATNYLRELVQAGRLKKIGIRAGTRYEPS